ncbi:lipocalin family protein [Pseudomonas wayambapalatensis]|uniref:lipocalin family protein n=1 Tax=Pseudomonas wayambapalatensis TaxID=485895 RepID=UPI003CF9D2E1
MAIRATLLIPCLALTLGACVGASPDKPPPKTMPVNLEQYQGKWYELARLPMFFQRDCVQSEANYQLREDGQVDVTNRCRDEDGEWQQATGIAQLQQPGQTDKLWVRFDNWFSKLAPDTAKGEYWVLYHDPDYRVAVVGHPNREYLWLLSRTPTVSERTRNQLLEVARQRGYDTRELIWRQPD